MVGFRGTPTPISTDSIDKAFALLQGIGIEKESYSIYEDAKIKSSYFLRDALRKPLTAVGAHPEMQPIHLVRLSLLFQNLRVTQEYQIS